MTDKLPEPTLWACLWPDSCGGGGFTTLDKTAADNYMQASIVMKDGSRPTLVEYVRAEQLRAALAAQAEAHAKETAVHDAFYKLTVSERDLAWREGDALRADAQRYRWLCDKSPIEWRLTVGDLECFKFDYDAAIDAARAAKGGGA